MHWNGKCKHMFYGREKRSEKGVCTYNDQFDWIDGKCLKGMMK